jgi:drug/metabolite transporter (DMT)-like permease
MFMTPWARRGMIGVRVGGPGLALQMLFIGVLTVASSVLFVAGLKYAGVAISTVLSSTAPMFAIPLGAVFLGERLAPRTVVGAVVTVAGLAVLEL